MGGKRKPKTEYWVWADYSLGWSENRGSRSEVRAHATEAEAMQSAIAQTGEMRRRGADSPVRSIRVIYWETGTPLRDVPVLYDASYYDPEQKLTDTEIYAARVHDRHEAIDRINCHSAAKNQPMWLTYRDWPDEWGPKPTTCPACDVVVDPQNMY
ncbi:Uncharacterised protein [Mycobacteroides abscessus subsp. massiliense]|uniref:Uncharacterized protein n=1 Tax=Mycobacteroides abscessus TaxID=36809 RepID=A0A0U0ZIQ7_9MYCO|nr:hypothetical protein D2E33_09390 [Mycobacteroides abscessus]SKL57832.1 Uncharacterised protein [Mycobacteroides abscessus subsp. massiliense]RIT62944.1 hypothetical protein D2E87_22530 [Mycobacteroides abscessus]CPV43198.1 Uncharacterised protein [Mycobacteroides abscessus]SKM82486.1 Uncharacterised protein [Mycobacteroides abscessus subsp. massiliense]